MKAKRKGISTVLDSTSNEFGRPYKPETVSKVLVLALGDHLQLKYFNTPDFHARAK